MLGCTEGKLFYVDAGRKGELVRNDDGNFGHVTSGHTPSFAVGPGPTFAEIEKAFNFGAVCFVSVLSLVNWGAGMELVSPEDGATIPSESSLVVSVRGFPCDFPAHNECRASCRLSP